MDLTKYGASPYAPGSPNRVDQNMSAVAAALRGLLGQDEPGSVLDPATALNKRINDAVQLGSIISDLAPIKGAGTGGAVLAGALRRGGRPDLFLSHGANANSLMKNGQLIRELTHPSMAITKDAPKAPFGDVMLIPREGKFDPRTSTSALHDMDAWTPTWDDNFVTNPYARSEWNDKIADKLSAITPQSDVTARLARAAGYLFDDNPAALRLADKFNARWPKGGLNQAGEEALGANRFPSFEAFENAKRGGVKRLEGGAPVGKSKLKYLANLSEEWGLPQPEILEALLKGDPGLVNAKHGVAYARELMKTLRQTPQDYAELKVFGHVPLTADNFAGAMMPYGTSDALVNALTDRGIRTFEFDPLELTSKNLLAKEADRMQNLSRMGMTPKAPSGVDLNKAR